MKKLPSACTVVVPRKASKSVTIKCSSAKSAKEAVAALVKSSSKSTKPTSSGTGSTPSRPPLLFAAAVVHKIGQALKKSGRSKASKKNFSDATAYAAVEMARRGYTNGGKLTAKGREQQAHQKGKSDHIFKMYAKYKREALSG